MSQSRRKRTDRIDPTRVYERFLAENRQLDGLVALYLDPNIGKLVVTVERIPDVLEAGFLANTGIEVVVEEGRPAKLLYASQMYLRVPPMSKIEGGDPIWHPANGWGTIAFARARIKFRDHQNNGRHLRNVVMGCNHILALLDKGVGNSPINSFRSTSMFALDYWWPVTNPAVDPVDVAFATGPSLTDYIPASVRGLGKITGIGTVTPGDRVFKCGAATSITTGIDGDKEYVNIPSYGRHVNLRRVPPGFADVGDSGSAVLNKNNELVGIVVAGRETASGIVSYYLPIIPLNGPDDHTGPNLKLEFL